jgi:hypothetical protein
MGAYTIPRREYLRRLGAARERAIDLSPLASSELY